MAKPDFAPGVVVDVKQVGPAGNKVRSERVKIACDSDDDALAVFMQLLESADATKKREEPPSPGYCIDIATEGAMPSTNVKRGDEKT